MATVDGTVQQLRRSRQVGQNAVFISVDASGTEVRLPTQIDRRLGEPNTLFVLITPDSLAELDEIGADDDTADADTEQVETPGPTDAEVAAEAAEEVDGEDQDAAAETEADTEEE